VEEFSRYPGHMFLSRDCIETLHEVLDIQVSSAAAEAQGAGNSSHLQCGDACTCLQPGLSQS
jgi:hypothetical protein